MTETPFPPALPGDAPVPTPAPGNTELIERVERIRDHRAIPLSEGERRDAEAGATPPTPDNA